MAAVAANNPPASASRAWRGWSCLATFAVAPLGWFVRGGFIQQMQPERLECGLILVMPGIEGRSFLNIAIMQGLLDAGLPHAIDIVDWTTGFKGFVLYHLRGYRRNLRVASALAERIATYRRDYPGRPVWIVGHSGGGGMALLTAAALPNDVRLTGVVLLAAAVSPRFDLRPIQGRVERGIWNYSSWLDWLFVGLGTTLCGTIDGVHGPAAGMIGFLSETDEQLPPLTQWSYQSRYIGQFNLGGHFGCVHRVFVAETIAPILADDSTEAQRPR